MLNFVIYSTKEDYYKIIYHDIIGKDNVRYIVSPVEESSLPLRLVYKAMMSPKLSLIFCKFRKYLNFLYDRNFDNDERIAFLFFYGRLPWVNYGLLKYLKKKHEKCLTVCYFQDLISKKNVDINFIKSEFDMVLSYDELESQKYSLIYEPTPFSYINIDKSKNEEFDVYFVGKAKERLADIYMIFDILTNNGYQCEFYISEVPHGKRRADKGLHYIEKNISYYESLTKLQNCNIILELMQTGAVGYTLRTWEAIAYNKILLTNNISLKTSSYYEKYNIVVFNAKDFDVIQLKNYVKKKYYYENEFSPTNLLNNIEKYEHY